MAWAESQAADAPTSPRPGLKVLIVDDNRDLAMTCSALLRMARCEVATAFDGPRGLEMACGFEPEAAILDIGLPGLDGHDLAHELRRRFGTGILLIAMSGYGQKDDVSRAFEAGFDHHLIKPVEIATLLGLLPH